MASLGRGPVEKLIAFIWRFESVTWRGVAIATLGLVAFDVVGTNAPALSASHLWAASPVQPRLTGLNRRLLTGKGARFRLHSWLAITRLPAAAPIRADAANYRFFTLSYPATQAYAANGINDAFRIGGNYDSDATTILLNGFVVTPPYSTADYSPVAYPNAQGTAVYGINNRGDLAGSYYSGSNEFGYVKHGNTYTSYANPKTTVGVTELLALNDRGFAVGNYYDSAYNAHGFVLNLRTGTYFELVPPGAAGNGVAVTGINDRNEVVGFIYSSSYNVEAAFSYKDGRYHQYTFPNAVATEAEGINNYGEIVGDYALVDGRSHGFALKDGKFVTVDDSNGSQGSGTLAFSVNDFGAIVGIYQDATLQTYGFLAIPK